MFSSNIKYNISVIIVIECSHNGVTYQQFQVPLISETEISNSEMETLIPLKENFSQVYTPFTSPSASEPESTKINVYFKGVFRWQKMSN